MLQVVFLKLCLNFCGWHSDLFIPTMHHMLAIVEWFTDFALILGPAYVFDVYGPKREYLKYV